MNTVWSDYIQGVKTLYYSRKLRFHDLFKEQYKDVFALDCKKKLRILEIGCGPGALAESLHRWYPNAEIVAVDRDSNFIEFAKKHVHGATFLEADIANLPFDEESFDVTISNTVCEHIDPQIFYGEQRRVLKGNGICIVLSARKSIHCPADCVLDSHFEQAFWERVSELEKEAPNYNVGQFAINERVLPCSMGEHGFRKISTNYIALDLTPDNERFNTDSAHDIINANRYNDLEAVDALSRRLTDKIAQEDILAMKKLINEKYDKRIAIYDSGNKLWDTSISLTMAVRGIK